MNKSFLARYRQSSIVWDMALSLLKAKYAGSRLGIWWAIIMPLVLAVSIDFVFTAVFKIHMAGYALFVLAGIIPWFFFTNALTEVTGVFLARSALLKQTASPREFVVIASILANFLNFLIGLLILLPLFIMAKPAILKGLVFLIPVIGLQFFFVLGLGLLCASVYVFYCDLTHFLSIAFMIWFWVTPVFYSLEMIEYPYRLVCAYNPMTYFIVSYRHILFEASPPELFHMALLVVISALSLTAGYGFFIFKKPELLKKV
jgi:ABC-type polysaccharide/polyol phosphate export permease